MEGGWEGERVKDTATHTHTGSWGPSDRVRGNRGRVRRGGEGWEISTLEGGKDNDR